MIFSKMQTFDVSPPKSMKYFEPNKRKYGSYVAIGKQIDRENKVFNKDGNVDKAVQARADSKLMHDAAEMIKDMSH